MDSRRVTATLLCLGALAWALPAQAQDAEDPPVKADGPSEQVESSDDAYRRRMELEDARRTDPSYTDPVDSYRKEPEKIDKLPQASRENIRDQLIDVIVANGEWEPSDALEEYPYEPSAAAQADPELMEQEQEAWDEQIQKYHEREAAAFGAHRGPVAGPGNPSGEQGSQQDGTGSEQGQAGATGGRGEGNAEGAGSAGTYEYRPAADSADESISTDGVAESALDFLKGRQAQAGQSPTASGATQDAAPGVAAQPGGAAEPSSDDNQSDSSAAAAAAEPDTPGLIAIEDLDKLEGAAAPPAEEGNPPVGGDG